MPADDISPIWGRSYRDISLEGYVHHRSQGVTPFLNSPFFRRPYALSATTNGALSVSDFAQPFTSLASVIPVPAEQPLADAPIARWIKPARRRRNSTGPTDRSIAEAGKHISGLEEQVKHRRIRARLTRVWELDQVRDASITRWRMPRRLKSFPRTPIRRRSRRNSRVRGRAASRELSTTSSKLYWCCSRLDLDLEAKLADCRAGGPSQSQAPAREAQRCGPAANAP